MSDSNIHGYITFGWVATIIGLLLFGALGNSYSTLGFQSSYYAVKCGQQNPGSPFASGYSASHKSKLIEKFESSIPTEKRDWCDLAAQQSMAEDTEGMHIAAWGGVVVGALGTAFLAWTILLTMQSIKTANNAIDVTREIGRSQVRAYLTCTSFEYALRDNLIQIVVSIKNTGNSPARKIVFGGDLHFSAATLNVGELVPKEKIFRIFFNSQPCSDIPGGGEGTGLFIMHKSDENSKVFEGLIKYGDYLNASCTLNWRDVFKDPGFAQFTCGIEGKVNNPIFGAPPLVSKVLRAFESTNNQNDPNKKHGAYTFES
jgi:hypothetical protein